MKKVWIVALVVFLLSGSSVEEMVMEDPSAYTEAFTTKNGVDYAYISFDDMAPEGYELNQCWNGIGMDDEGRVYIGWTSLRPDGIEDFVIYQYDPETKQRKLVGTMMTASEEANNLEEGEAIPKGHTEMICVDGKMYMASQSFHDFKEEIDDLAYYRGAHLYEYDIKKGTFTDISAKMPGGVVIENEGIVGMTYMAATNQLIGLTHPHSSMVFIDLKSGKVAEVVEGIPWQLGNPLSREVIVDKYGKVYLYRGTEMPDRVEESFSMWVYDTNTRELYETDQSFHSGFWSGQAHTSDGDTIYISTVNGGLFSLDTETSNVSDLGAFIPLNMEIAKVRPMYLYDITLSHDEETIYALPPAEYGNLFEYDIESGRVLQAARLPDDIYCSNNLKGPNGELYFAKFKPWSGQGRLMIVSLPN